MTLPESKDSRPWRTGRWTLGPAHRSYAIEERRRDGSDARTGGDRLGDGRDRRPGRGAALDGLAVTAADRTPLGTNSRGTPARGLRLTPLGWAHVSLEAKARIDVRLGEVR